MNIFVKISVVLFAIVLDVSASPLSTFNIIAKLDTGPGNLTITEEGRIIMSMHQFYAPNFTVVELKKDK